MGSSRWKTDLRVKVPASVTWLVSVSLYETSFPYIQSLFCLGKYFGKDWWLEFIQRLISATENVQENIKCFVDKLWKF